MQEISSVIVIVLGIIKKSGHEKDEATHEAHGKLGSWIATAIRNDVG